MVNDVSIGDVFRFRYFADPSKLFDSIVVFINNKMNVYKYTIACHIPDGRFTFFPSAFHEMEGISMDIY